MVILFLLFIVQFSVACACLAVGDEQIRTLMEQGWRLSKNDTRQSVQDYWDCCGFYGHTFSPLQVSANLTERNVFTLNSHPTCSEVWWRMFVLSYVADGAEVVVANVKKGKWQAKWSQWLMEKSTFSGCWKKSKLLALYSVHVSA